MTEQVLDDSSAESSQSAAGESVRETIQKQFDLLSKNMVDSEYNNESDANSPTQKNKSEEPEEEELDEEPSEDEEDSDDDEDESAEENDDEGDDVDEDDDDFLAPTSWSKDAKKAFYELPKHLQAEIVKRDQQQSAYFTQKTQEAAEVRERFSDYETIEQDFSERFNQIGVPPGEVIRNLVLWDLEFTRDPVAGISKLAAQFNIPISINGYELQQERESAVPQNVIEEIEELKAKLAGYEQARTTELQQKINTQIVDWASEKDSSGRLKRPYVMEVEEDMLVALQALKDKNLSLRERLDKAYKIAISSNDDISIKLEAAKKKETVESSKLKSAQLKSKKVSLKQSAEQNLQEEVDASDLRAVLRYNLRKLSGG